MEFRRTASAFESMTTLEQSKPADEARDSVPRSGDVSSCNDLLARMVELPISRINEAITKYNPKLVVALFSGGHDSLSAVKATSLAKKFDGCLHVNTGIGIEATREYVRATCAENGWPLSEYHALENTKADGTPDPMDYVKEVMKVGFPGPPQHYIMYIKLKQRSIERYLRDVGATPKSPVLFVTGARTEESTRRMGNTAKVCEERGRSIWLNAIHDWTKSNTGELIEYAGLKRNLVVDLIHKSGECLCGAFAEKGELEELKLWPQTRPCYDRIIKLQEEVIAAGFPWGWEDRPPKWWAESECGQSFMLQYDENEAWGQPLCHKCNHGAMRANT